MKIMKKFIFRYDPAHSANKMFADLKQAMQTGEKHLQPKNVSLTSDVEVIYQILNKQRLSLFNCLVEKKPNSLVELAQLLNREYQEVEEDSRILEDMGIIKFKKQDRNIEQLQPIALYEKIVIEFSTARAKEATPLPQARLN
jgi:predicted transcriptional regulator